MKIYCLVNELEPECVDKYVKIHENAHLSKWKTQLEALKNAGAKNCNVYVYKNLSIVLYECENIDESFEKLSQDPNNKKWQKEVGEFFLQDPKFDGSETVQVRKIFDMNQQLKGFLESE